MLGSILDLCNLLTGVGVDDLTGGDTLNKFSKVTRSIYKSVILLYMYIIIHAIYKNELHLQ